MSCWLSQRMCNYRTLSRYVWGWLQCHLFLFFAALFPSCLMQHCWCCTAEGTTLSGSPDSALPQASPRLEPHTSWVAKEGWQEGELYMIIKVCIHSRVQANQEYIQLETHLCLQKWGKLRHLCLWGTGCNLMRSDVSVSFMFKYTSLVTPKDKALFLGWSELSKNMNWILSPTSTYFYAHAERTVCFSQVCDAWYSRHKW